MKKNVQQGEINEEAILFQSNDYSGNDLQDIISPLEE